MQNQNNQDRWPLLRDFEIDAVPITKLRESLLEESQLDLNYLLMTVSSCLMATFGLLVNSTTVLIAAMIMGPLMMPLRAFSFATLAGDLVLLRRSFFSIVAGAIASIACSCLVGTFIGLPEFGQQVLTRTQPNLIDLLIGVVGGGISGYTKIRSSLGDGVSGTAIAVALMTPLCVVGLTLSQGEWDYSWGAFLLYATNLIGINLACLLVYLFSGYARSNELSRSLSWVVSLMLIALLAVPLGLSFWKLTQQAQVNESVREILVERTLFDNQALGIIDSEDIDWSASPPSVKVTVQSTKIITPEEVSSVENSIEDKLGRRLKLVFHVTRSQRVESPRVNSN